MRADPCTIGRREFVRSPHLSAIAVTFFRGLLFQGTGQLAPYGMIATSDTEFYCNDTPALIRFLADEKGNVDKTAIKLGDKEQIWVPHFFAAVAKKWDNRARLHPETMKIGLFFNVLN